MKFEEVQLIYRNRTPASNRPNVKCPKDAYDILLKNWDMNLIGLIEECKVLLLDRSLKLMSVASVSKGGMSGTIVDPKVIFSMALKRRASSIILAHNHPSGNLEPSDADIGLTRNFMAAGKVLQIPLQDHIIITKEGYNSIISDGYILANDR
ncbi:MAG: JAB domain-containing protein [Reichenbachiella sp.]|uniref:JAB domain-containing protein n=1 Tax=Reichenbachiella sp. TaxID=2184521 RepID=UPI0032663BDD